MKWSEAGLIRSSSILSGETSLNTQNPRGNGSRGCNAADAENGKTGGNTLFWVWSCQSWPNEIWILWMAFGLNFWHYQWSRLTVGHYSCTACTALKLKEVEPWGSVMNTGRLWRLLCLYACDDNFDLSSSTECVPCPSNIHHIFAKPWSHCSLSGTLGKLWNYNKHQIINWI